jgi:hypothetical protein
VSLSEDNWILVKKRLNAGEQRQLYARMYKRVRAGEAAELDPLQMDLAPILAYLVDWSLTDAEGKPVIIRGLPADQLTATLNALGYPRFLEIMHAITRHQADMDAEREAEKKTLMSGPPSSAISPSRSAADGGTNGSANWMPMSTPSSSMSSSPPTPGAGDH